MTSSEAGVNADDALPVVLVTGSSGHLGAAFMIMLPQLGYRVVGLDIKPSDTTEHVGSITDRGLVAEILQRYHVRHILHTATLHKPHVGSHTKQQFIDTNINGTLVLLEEAAKLEGQIESFVFFSTTSTFGAALSPEAGSPAVWIDETVTPIPKNIYGATKTAAEDICQIMHKETKLPIIILRTSRFFPEEDDDEEKRNAMTDDNLKVLEMAYRRCDIEDIVMAGIGAMTKARSLQFEKFIISAPPPFPNTPEVLRLLESDPAAVFATYVPGAPMVMKKKGWKHLPRIDRVYDSRKAILMLGWRPRFTFSDIIELLSRDQDWRSGITTQIGKRGYHDTPTGVYTKF